MNIENLPAAIAILTSMITPALLISACGTLILSTSTRLGRVTDRVRNLSVEMEQLADATTELVLRDERRAVVLAQIEMLSSRARVLQRALTLLYISVCAFVATSVLIGLTGVLRVQAFKVVVALGLVGVGLLFFVSALLIYEARLSRVSLRVELDFLLELGHRFAPEGMARPRRGRFRRERDSVRRESRV